MSRKLLKQIRNEWRSNVWLLVELIIVSVVLFVLVDRLATTARLTSEDIGVDITDTYVMTLSFRPEESPDYLADRVNKTDLAATVERLRTHPDIEAVDFGSTAVYNYDFSGNNASVMLDTLTSTEGRMNTFFVMPDYVKVFKPRGYRGESPEQLADVLRRGDYIVTSNFVDNLAGCTDPNELYNKEIYFGSDSVPAHIGAVVAPIKRSDTEPAWHSTLIKPINKYWNPTLYLRTPAGRGQAVIESLRSQEQSYFVGNVYLSDIKSFDTIRSDVHRSDRVGMRNMYICVGFLLATVFLGLLGTFWFRTQQRVREIGIRMVAGATGRSVFRRLMGEGLLILLLATPVAMALDAVLVYEELALNKVIYPAGAWLFSAGLAAGIAVLIAAMIVAGIWFPARRAMSVDAASVLRNE